MASESEGRHEARRVFPPDLAEALARADASVALRLTFLREVDSTNDEALRLASMGAPDGTAVLAGLQRAGRGRRGRTWFSPPDAGIYLSIVVRPCDWPGGVPLVTLAAGVAVARAVEAASGLRIELKWPNDLVIGRPWRKLGGVLSEAVGGTGGVGAVVVGIGINVRPSAYPVELADRATSLEAELGRQADRGSLVVALLTEFASVVGRMRAGGARWICDEWRALARPGLGRAPVRWQQGSDWRAGAAVDIDDEGALVVDVEGQRERIIAGEVFWDRVGS